MRSIILAFVLLSAAGPAVPGQVDRARDDFNFAAGLHDRGLHERAIKAFESFLRTWSKDERDARAHFFLGQSLVALGRHEEALPHFRACGSGRGGELRNLARLREGETLQVLGRHAEAYTCLSALMAEAPDDAVSEAVRYFLAESAVASGRRDEGRRLYSSLVSDASASRYRPFAALALGFLQHEDGRFAEAVASFRAAARAKDEPDLVLEARVMEAEARLEDGDCAGALERLEELRNATTGSFTPQILLGIARAQLGLDRPAAALATWKECGERFPEDPRVTRGLIQAASLLHRSGEHALGLEVVAAVRDARGADAEELAYWSGKLLTASGRMDSGIEQLRAAVAEGGTPEVAARRRFTLAEALARAGRHEEAVALFAQVRTGSTDTMLVAESAFAEAFSANRLGRFEPALVLLNGLAKRELPRDLDADVKFALAENLFALKRFDQALAWYEAVLAMGSSAHAEGALYKKGWSLYRLARHGPAIQTFTQLVAAHPAGRFAAEAAYLVGKCHEAAGRPAEARRTFEALSGSLEKGELAARAQLAAAAAARQEGDLSAARDAYQRALAMSAGDAALEADAGFGLAETLFDLGEHAAAAQAFEALLRDHPDHARAPAVRLSWAWALRQLGRHGASLDAARHLRGRTRDVALAGEATYLVALELQALEKPDEAAEILAPLVDAQPAHARAAEARLLRGVCLAQAECTEDAIQALRPFIASPPELEGRDRALYELGFCHHTLGDEAARRTVLLRLVEEHPESSLVPDALFRLGESAYEEQRWEEALSAYERLAAHGAVGELADRASYKAGWSLRHLERHEEAARRFATVASLAASALAGESRFLAGEACSAAGQHPDAAEHFRQMVADHPRHELASKAALRYVLAIAASGNHEAVIRSGPAALAQSPEGPLAVRVWAALGDAFFARRSFERARAAYREVTARSEGPMAARAQYRIGLANLASGDSDEAIDEFLKVVILYGHAEWTAKASLAAANLLLENEQPAKARRLYEELLRDHPRRPEAKEAREKLDSLERER